MNANEGYPWMLMRKCLLAMLILMLVFLMLILMLLNLITGYSDTDADLCIRIMSLCCMSLLKIILEYDKSVSFIKAGIFQMAYDVKFITCSVKADHVYFLPDKHYFISFSFAIDWLNSALRRQYFSYVTAAAVI